MHLASACWSSTTPLPVSPSRSMHNNTFTTALIGPIMKPLFKNCKRGGWAHVQKRIKTLKFPLRLQVPLAFLLAPQPSAAASYISSGRLLDARIARRRSSKRLYISRLTSATGNGHWHNSAPTSTRAPPLARTTSWYLLYNSSFLQPLARRSAPSANMANASGFLVASACAHSMYNFGLSINCSKPFWKPTFNNVQPGTPSIGYFS
mmetsp:Transcript_13246/g.35465  ORF Transcript_13246/g.35465 Transcript_13246/m.35465 type:complete len:206 (-) Transcript_13246:303-920(-)